MSDQPVISLTDPRRYGDGAHPWLALDAVALAQAARAACAGGADAEIAAALAAAPSQRDYARLWQAVCDAAHGTGGEAAGVVARFFALPLVIVTGARHPLELAGALPDVDAVCRLFTDKGTLGLTRNFGLGNALCALETLEAVRPSEIHAWTAAAGALRRELPPAPLVVAKPGEEVHLRFLVGAAIGPAHEPPFVETASNIGAWGMDLTRLLAAQLAPAGVEVLPIPRPPADLLRAAHPGRTAQLETAASLFASNAVRRFRMTGGEPVAILSVHDDADLRLTLSQPFDDSMVEGFRWPLHPLDDLAAVAAMLGELLGDCRLARIEVAPRVLPARHVQGHDWYPTVRDWPQLAAH